MVEEPWRKVDVLFVGEAPGAEEDSKGTPFVGKAGRYLRGCWRVAARTPIASVGFANVCRCRPPRNREPNKTEVHSCGHRLVEEIGARDPKVVVALGGVAMKFLTGNTGVTNLQGTALRCTVPGLESIPVVACFHPAYILRVDVAEDDFVAALQLADRYARGLERLVDGEGDYVTVTTADDVCALMDQMRESGLVAWDTETGSLSPFDEEFPNLLCVSFSDEEGVGYTVPIDHIDSPWCRPSQVRRAVVWHTRRLRDAASRLEERMGRKSVTKRKRAELRRESDAIGGEIIAWEGRLADAKRRWSGGGRRDRARVVGAIKRLLEDPGVAKVGHNVKFDIKHVGVALGIDHDGLARDTMTTHYMIDERGGSHGLKSLAHRYTGMGGYDRPLDEYKGGHPESDPGRGGSYANIPGDILFRYAAMDADATLRVDAALLRDDEYADNPRLGAWAERFYPMLIPTLAGMEIRGAAVDLGAVEGMDREYAERADEIGEKIRRCPEVVQYVADRIADGVDDFGFNSSSDYNVRDVLFGYCGLDPVELTDTGLEILRERLGVERRRNGSRRVSFDKLVNRAKSAREWSLFSVKAEVLQEYAKAGNALSALILDHRKYAKVRGTFIEPILEMAASSGLVHGSFNPAGTVTGRLSSSGPNLMNVPKAARAVYVSRFGGRGVLLQADFSQIELRIAASVYNEPTMIQAYTDGVDIHVQTALITSGMSRDEYDALPRDEQASVRSIYGKTPNFLLIYGGTAMKHRETLKRQGVFRSIEDCEADLERFFAGRPDLAENMDRLRRGVQRRGYLDTATGRRRRLPEAQSDDDRIVARALRQAGNTPVQGPASDMTLLSLVHADRELASAGMESVPILTVHDSIVFDCPWDEVLPVARAVKWIMEHVPEYADEYLPGADWSWLRAPVRADFEAGRSWYPMVGFDPDSIAESGGGGAGSLSTRDGGPSRPPESLDELRDAVDRAYAGQKS